MTYKLIKRRNHYEIVDEGVAWGEHSKFISKNEGETDKELKKRAIEIFDKFVDEQKKFLDAEKFVVIKQRTV